MCKATIFWSVACYCNYLEKVRVKYKMNYSFNSLDVSSAGPTSLKARSQNKIKAEIIYMCCWEVEPMTSNKSH